MGVSLISVSGACDKRIQGDHMISRCANPECSKPFHYLRGGRLYRFDARTTAATTEDLVNAVHTISPSQVSVFFWLCEECSSKLSLRFDGHIVAVVPAQVSARHSDTPVVPVGNFEMRGTKLQGANH
jgi:hypothetical protein